MTVRSDDVLPQVNVLGSTRCANNLALSKKGLPHEHQKISHRAKREDAWRMRSIDHYFRPKSVLDTGDQRA
jgi:hypothetical protein